jgi:hypothetical protein
MWRHGSGRRRARDRWYAAMHDLGAAREAYTAESNDVTYERVIAAELAYGDAIAVAQEFQVPNVPPLVQA